MIYGIVSVICLSLIIIVCIVGFVILKIHERKVEGDDKETQNSLKREKREKEFLEGKIERLKAEISSLITGNPVLKLNLGDEVVIREETEDGTFKDRLWQIAEIRMDCWCGKRGVEYIATNPEANLIPGEEYFGFEDEDIGVRVFKPADFQKYIKEHQNEKAEG